MRQTICDLQTANWKKLAFISDRNIRIIPFKLSEDLGELVFVRIVRWPPNLCRVTRVMLNPGSADIVRSGMGQRRRKWCKRFNNVASMNVHIYVGHAAVFSIIYYLFI